MILRIWHGYTTKSNAAIYERMLEQEILPEIAGKNIKGYKRAQFLRRELDRETEFTTMLWFDNIESIVDFVGKDYESVYVPEKARKVLSRFDSKAIHCELRGTFEYDD